MISSQIIQKTLDELRTITRIDLCVMDIDGKVNSSTFPVENEDFGDVRAFADSMADSQVMRGYHFFKIYDNQTVEYVLIAKGSNEDAYMIGRVAVAEIQNLIVAYKERFDKSNFIQNLILDNLLLVDVYNRAKKLHIPVEAKRVVLLIETKNEKDQDSMDNQNMQQSIVNLWKKQIRNFCSKIGPNSCKRFFIKCRQKLIPYYVSP